MNKRGDFFALYLPILTITMCVIVIALYFVGQEKSNNSLVSPRAVLEFRDEVYQYEIFERELILESLDEAGGFGSNDFNENFRRIFLEKLDESSQMKDLFFRNMIRENEARADGKAYFNSLYFVSSDGKNIIFARGSATKFLRLKAEESASKINFPVDFSYTFEKKYLISFQDNKYIVGAE